MQNSKLWCEFSPAAARLAPMAALAVCLLATGPRPAGAHGTDTPPAPTAEQLAAMAPPAAGAEEFSRKLLGSGRYHFTGEQAVLAEKTASAYALARRVAAGEFPNVTTGTAAYQQALGDEALARLLAAMPEALTYDFRLGGKVPNVDTPVPVTGLEADLVVRVITGDGPTRFDQAEFDLTPERWAYPGVARRFPVQPGGTTWLLLSMGSLSPGKHTLQVSFPEEMAGGPVHFTALTIQAPQFGQLALGVLDAETSSATPAMLRLTALPSGRLYEPPNAVDLRPLTNAVTQLDIYGPGRGYKLWMFGEPRGHYWAVPGPFEMALPVGDYEVYAYKGPEYAPVRKRFTVQANSWTRKQVELSRWTDMPRRGWYSGDDHVHARLMNSNDAQQLLLAAQAMDVSISNILEMGNEARTWYAQRGFGPEFQVGSGHHWLVPGQEDPRSVLGHAIGLNIKSMARDLDKYLLNDWVATELHRQGGLYGHTHVGAKALNVEREMTMMAPTGLVDFNSIMQANLGTDLFYQFLDMGYPMTASAGSDTPYGGFIGVTRVYACTGTDRPLTPQAWFDAVKAGRTFVTNGPMLEFTVNQELPGSHIAVKSGSDMLKVRARATGLAGQWAPKHLRLVRLGETLREARSTDTQRQELSIDAEVPAEFGFWIAAEATGFDGTQAHSTPIYIERPGFRPWNPGRVRSLVQERESTLQEIERVLTAAERMKAAGRLSPIDYWNRWAAEQAPAVRERIAVVRRAYRDLLAQLDAESAARSISSGGAAAPAAPVRP